MRLGLGPDPGFVREALPRGADLHQEVLLFEHQIVTQLLDRKGRLPSMEHAAQAFIVKVQERGGPLLTEKWSAFTVEKPAVAGPSRPDSAAPSVILC